MKNVLLITITVLSSISAFAAPKVLLTCSDKFNSLTVTANDDNNSIEINRESRNGRQLMYVDRIDQSEQNPVVVNSYDDSSNSAMLDNAKAVAGQSSINISFTDKKNTKMQITFKP